MLLYKVLKRIKEKIFVFLLSKQDIPAEKLRDIVSFLFTKENKRGKEKRKKVNQKSS